MNEKTLENYLINNNTLAILPAAHIAYRSIVLEGEKQLFIKKPPLKLVEIACLCGGADFKGRRKSVIHQTGIQRKVPIPINPRFDIIAFPTHAPDKFDCQWIFYNHIQSILPHSNNTKQSVITFTNDKKLIVDIAPALLVKQVYRTAFCAKKFSYQHTGSLYPSESI